MEFVGSYPSTDPLALLETVSGKMIGLLAAQRLVGVTLRYDLRNPSCTFTDMKRTSAEEEPYIWGSGKTSPEIPNKGTGGSKERTGVLQKLLGLIKI